MGSHVITKGQLLIPLWIFPYLPVYLLDFLLGLLKVYITSDCSLMVTTHSYMEHCFSTISIVFIIIIIIFGLNSEKQAKLMARQPKKIDQMSQESDLSSLWNCFFFSMNFACTFLGNVLNYYKVRWNGLQHSKILQWSLCMSVGALLIIAIAIAIIALSNYYSYCNGDLMLGWCLSLYEWVI